MLSHSAVYVTTTCVISVWIVINILESLKVMILYPYRISTTGRSVLAIYPRSAASTNKRTKICFVRIVMVHVCFKCVIVGHQIHKIKNQTDFEQELRLKVNVVLDLDYKGT